MSNEDWSENLVGVERVIDSTPAVSGALQQRSKFSSQVLKVAIGKYRFHNFTFSGKQENPRELAK